MVHPSFEDISYCPKLKGEEWVASVLVPYVSAKVFDSLRTSTVSNSELSWDFLR